MLIECQKTKKILKSYGIDIKGILHVGAYKCEERSLYHSWGLSDENIIWIDANLELVKENIDNGIINCYWAVLDETERDKRFKIGSNGKLISLSDLEVYNKTYPDVYFTKEIELKTQTLAQFIENNNIDMSKFNVWVFDIEDSVYTVLNGSKEYLKYADCIYTDIKTADSCKECVNLDNLDTFLKEFVLKRIPKDIKEDGNSNEAIYRREFPFYKKDKITLGITTYKRYHPYLEQYIPKYLNFDGIDEILICDDSGDDIEMIKKQPWGNNSKLKLIKNPERLGCFLNKLNVLRRADNEWIILMDSDNELLPEYLEGLKKFWNIYGPDKDCVYLPLHVVSKNVVTGYIVEPIAHLGQFCINKSNWNYFHDLDMAEWALNMMNCVFHRSQVEFINDTIPKGLNPIEFAIDSKFITSTLVKKGFKLILVPGMKYYHISHPGSLYFNNIDLNSKLNNELNWKI